MGGWPPRGCWVPKQGHSPRPGRRMAQEAFEAYGKSSPLPALPHLPFPAGYVPPPVSMGTGGSRHGTLSTMLRRGDYRRGATAAGDPGVRGLYHGAGREGPASPRDCVVPTSCLRRACNGGETIRAPLPPPPTPAPRGQGMRVGGGAKSDTPPEGNAAGWRGSGRRVQDETHDRARRGHTPCKPRRGDHRGSERRVERATTGAARHAPPPLQRDGCRALCLRQESNEGKNDKAPLPPPHTPPPPQGVGDAGREGRTAAPPPEDKVARWGGSRERVRDGQHDRAQGEQVLCRPQRGGRLGSERRVGRAMTGATRRTPLPSRRTSAAPRASTVPATCLRRRKGSEAPPPSPPPTPTPTEERGEGSEGMAWGHAG